MLAELLLGSEAMKLGAEGIAVELQIPDKLLITFLGGKMGSRAAAVEHLVNATMPQVRCSQSVYSAQCNSVRCTVCVQCTTIHTVQQCNSLQLWHQSRLAHSCSCWVPCLCCPDAGQSMMQDLHMQRCQSRLKAPAAPGCTSGHSLGQVPDVLVSHYSNFQLNLTACSTSNSTSWLINKCTCRL